MFEQRTFGAWRTDVRTFFVGCLFALACIVPVLPLKAETVVQGVLQLQWADPPRALPGRVQKPPQLDAWLETGPGRRIALDVSQARRAAGDLYALANRRVAVSYGTQANVASSSKVMAASQPTQVIQAIVPTDRLPQRALAAGADGRVMASAPVLGATRWITLMCKFADIATEQKPREYFQAQYGNAPGQLGHYWSEVSYGQVNLAGSSAHGWYTLPQPRAAYMATVNGKEKAQLSTLFADCAAAAMPRSTSAASRAST